MKLIASILLLIAGLSVSTFSQSRRDDGIDLFRQAKYDMAIETLQDVVNKDKKDRLAWMFLGGSLFHAGKRSKAADAFRNGRLSANETIDGYNKQLKITRKPRPLYTDRARKEWITGKVVLVVEFLADGKIGFVVPVQELGGGLTQNCLSVAKQIKFDAAEVDEKPVTTIGFVEYNFAIH
jgi:hypothetical protein